MKPSKIIAIIVAGGVGKRLKSRIHKPFVPLGRRPMLTWTLQAFEKSNSVDGIILVTHRRDVARARKVVRAFRFRKIGCIVPGGETRMDSVWRGMQALPPETQWVAVHDAARPLVTPELIEATIRGARRAKAAIAAVPVVPTVKQAVDGWVEKTLDRSRLWAVQTPQVFERGLLEKAHQHGRGNGFVATDDAALVERLGHRVRIVEGSPRNIKITTREDLVVAEALMKSNGMRS